MSDNVTGKEMVLTDEDIDLIERIQASQYPEKSYDPYAVRQRSIALDHICYQPPLSLFLSLSIPPPSLFLFLPLFLSPHQIKPYEDVYSHEKLIHPMVSRPEPKSRFLPSLWERKKITRMAKAIKCGSLKPLERPQKPRFYMLWDESTEVCTNQPYR